MKELSIEEKAYDESLERARIAHKDEDKHLRATLERIFPELADSEDERIRKWLIAQLKIKIGDNATLNNMIYKAIAWLEKQCDKDNQLKLPTFTFDDILALQCCMETVKKVQEDKDLYEKLNDLHGRVYDTYHLEKQSVQKPFDYENANIQQTDFAPKSAMEAIREERVDNANKIEPKDYSSIDPHYFKPVDKLEPEFKTGQWIVWKDKCYKVNYNGCGYELIDQNGLSTSLEYGTVDENAHLWTIQDAKDGDVLACNEKILLFKSYSVQGRISLYCLYCWYDGCEHINNFHSKEVVDILMITRNKIYPATKEQRDLLFTKMKEAGYEWDVEKKELKKIEQKPDETVKRSPQEESNPNKKPQRIVSAEAKEAMYDKPWSEEDEIILKRLMLYLSCRENITPEVKSKYMDWLKSLRPQNRWKPSDEQIEILDMVLSNESMDDNVARILRELREQLKKLREE